MTGRPSSPPSLQSRALRWLARREHSRQELAQKLAPHAADAQEVQAVLDALQREGWLSDERFAEALSRQRAQRYGLRRVQADLRAKGVDEATIDAATHHLADSEAQRAQAAWSRRFGTPPPSAQERARQIRHLIAKGFAPELAARTVPRVHSAAEADDAFSPDGA